MNLTIAEVRELPLPAALLDRDGEIIAATPEWSGAGPGTVLFALRQTSLAVTVVPADPAAAALLDGLLAAIEMCIRDSPASPRAAPMEARHHASERPWRRGSERSLDPRGG